MNRNMKYKAGDKVRIESEKWYKQMLSIPNKLVWQNKLTNDFIGLWCGSHIFKKSMYGFLGKTMTIQEVGIDFYLMEEDTCGYEFNDEMIEGLVEEEIPKFKIDDIVFVKNIGWVRITNSYWDSLANEYIYEAIGFNGEGEYDSINQSNIECQMLPESENPHTCGNKITLDEYKNNDKEWLFNKLAMLDNITALESIQDIFNHLQQSKYPKTYEECCEILGCVAGYVWGGYKGDLIKTFHMLYICRDAYWKLYGEEMGLDKPWEPDYKNPDIDLYVIINIYNQVEKAKYGYGFQQCVLTFPTEEMRDAFYKAFKEEIEFVKELL